MSALQQLDLLISRIQQEINKNKYDTDDNTRQLSIDKNVMILKDRIGNYTSNESVCAYKSFIPRSNDIIVNTYHRSGTVWTGFIVHMIRSNCNIESFNSVADFMPFINIAYDLGIDLHSDQFYSPRLFMTHSYHNTIPKGGKIIHVIRDPSDILPSLHRLFTNFLCHNCDINSFSDYFIFSKESPFGTPFDNLLSWMDEIKNNINNINNNDICILFYDDLHENRLLCVERILKFMGYDINDTKVKQLRDKVYNISSHQNMLNINHKLCFHRLFREFLKKNPQIKEKHFGKDIKYENIKFSLSQTRKGGGNIGDGKKLYPHLAEKCQLYWDKKIKPVTNTANFQEFRLKYSFLHQS
eukprot:343852_1